MRSVREVKDRVMEIVLFRIHPRQEVDEAEYGRA